MRVLLDSVILIDHLNDIRVASEYLEIVNDQAVVSVVTRAEVLVGYSPAEVGVAFDLLAQFSTLHSMPRLPIRRQS